MSRIYKRLGLSKSLRQTWSTLAMNRSRGAAKCLASTGLQLDVIY